jgi:hypothetical protein
MNGHSKKSTALIYFFIAFAASLSLAMPHKKKPVSVPRMNSMGSSEADQRLQSLFVQISQRPIINQSKEDLKIECDANKVTWLRKIYSLNLVEASKLTELLSDKLIQYKIFSRFLGHEADKFMLHSIGLKEFLIKYNLADLNGNILQDPDMIEAALAEEFPFGFVARPALGVAPSEKNHGLFKSNDLFLQELLKKESSIYQSKNLRQMIASHITRAIESGEAIVLQEDLLRMFSITEHTSSKNYERVRVHAFESRLVGGASPELWVGHRGFDISKNQMNKIDAFVQNFLSKLPTNLTTRQAWGIDVAVLPSGQMKIVDIVTNRGQKIAWSSYLEQPRVIGAYSRHLESAIGLHFTGLAGELIRHDLANYFNYWRVRREIVGTEAQASLSELLPPSLF